MTATTGKAFFPGGVALTRISVYDWEADDGVCGGSPHMHTASTEAYLVIGGSGRVETITASGYESHRLGPDDLLWFGPGTIHRIINTGNLDVLAIMQNGGLPEAGDAVLTFEPHIVADRERYTITAALDGGGGQVQDSLAHVVRARRDAALAGYTRLKSAAQAGDFAAVERFQRDAVGLVRDRVPAWRELWEHSIAPESRHTEQWLADLAEGGFSHFKNATVSRSVPGGTDSVFGMCGMLQKWNSGRAT